MINQFEVTLDHFIVEDGKALAAKGAKRLGKMGSGQLLQLLRIFQETNPVQSFEADPEIIIQTRNDKNAVRTDLHKLLLYDLKNINTPAMVLSAEEVVAEVNESAAEARKARLHPDTEEVNAPPRTSALYYPAQGHLAAANLPWKLGLLTFLLAIACLSCLSLLHSPAPIEPDSIIKDPAEITALQRELVGVYSTGDTPGHHGIVLLDNGAIKLFEINKDAPPSLLLDTYKLGWYQGKRCLLINQLDQLILVSGKDTLWYCGATYQKAR